MINKRGLNLDKAGELGYKSSPKCLKDNNTMHNKSALIELINQFVPKAIRGNHKLSREMQIRAQGMVAILGISILLPLLILMSYVALQLFTQHDFTHDIIALIITETVLVSQHLYFQSYGNLRVTAGAYSLQYLFVITAVILVSGGWSHSPLLILLIGAPLLAFITMSSRAALVYIALVFIIIAGLLVIQIKKIPLPDISHAGNYPYTMFICWGVTLTFLSIFVVFCEKLSQERNR
jgi:hypothetical protein